MKAYGKVGSEQHVEQRKATFKRDDSWECPQTIMQAISEGTRRKETLKEVSAYSDGRPIKVHHFFKGNEI